jgi:quinol monooxygenase YgiN
MIFIVAKFPVRPEHAERWPDIVGAFTAATRSEPGNLWFDWSRSLDDPHEYVLVEAFRDQDAAVAHVSSDHFKAAQRDLPPYLVRTPRIINVQDVPGEEWSLLGELAVPEHA